MNHPRSWRPTTTAIVTVATIASLSACGARSSGPTADADTHTTREAGTQHEAEGSESGLPDWMLLPIDSGSDVVTFLTQPAGTGTVWVSDAKSEPYVLAADALFEPNSASLTLPALNALRRFARSLPKGRLKVEIVGFTDHRGSVEDNLALGTARADAVGAVFVEELGERVELRTASSGESEAVGITPEEMALDRRVVITVTAP